MSSYKYRVEIAGVGPRPPFGEVVDHVYGAGTDVDTDGDSETASATNWGWLYMCQRSTRNAPVVEVMLAEDRSDVMIVVSDHEGLALQVAEYLAVNTGGNIDAS